MKKSTVVKQMKSLAIILVLILLFTGCKQKPEKTSQTATGKTTQKSTVKTSQAATGKTTQKSTAKTSTTQQTEENGEDSDGDSDSDEKTPGEDEPPIGEKVFNLNGREISWTSASGFPAEGDSPVWDYHYNKIKEYEENYNFKIRYITGRLNWDFYTDLEVDALAGVKTADIFTCESIFAFPKYVKNDFILPLDDYIDFSTPLMQASDNITQGVYYQGKHWGYPYMGAHRIGSALITCFNRGILEQEGLPEVLDLFDSNQWTWEAMIDMAQKATRDLNGDGVVDQWGITTTNASTIMSRAFIYSNGVSVVERNDQDKFIYAVDTPAGRRALQYFSDVFFVYKVSPNRLNTSFLYRTGMGLFMFSRAIENKAALDNGVKSGAVCLPMGPDVNNYQNIWKSFFVAVSSLTEKPEEVAAILQPCFTTWDEEGNKLPELEDPDFIGPYYYTKRDQEAVGSKLPPGKLDFFEGFADVSPIWRQLVDDIYLRQMPISTGLDIYGPQVAAVLN